MVVYNIQLSVVSIKTTRYCIKPDGEEVFTYNSPDLRDTWGVTTDNHGNVYIVGRYSDNIHRLRPDGTFIDIILKEEHNITYVITITYSNVQRCTVFWLRFYFSNRMTLVI
jgi:hypothetical protein